MPPSAAQLTDWSTRLNTAFSTTQFLVSADGTGLTLGAAPTGGAPNIFVTPDLNRPTFYFEGGQYSRAHPLTVELFDGFQLHLVTFSITYDITTHSFWSPQITAILDMPMFFSHGGQIEQADMVVLLNDGAQTCTLALAPSQDSPARVAADGSFKLAFTLDSPSSSSLISQVSLEFHIAQMVTQRPSNGGPLELVMGGKLTLATPQRDTHAQSIDWPEFQFNGLRSDSQGNIALDGGWLDLKDAAALNFTGFHAILHKVGFGVIQAGADKHRWIGFSGEIKLGNGVEFSGKVIGLRVDLDAGDVSMTGIAVGLVVPNVFTLKGELDVIQARNADDLNALDTNITLPSTAAADWFPIHLVFGEIELKIDAVAGLDVDAKLISGSFGAGDSKLSVFFIDIGATFTPGIVIFSNISLYGLEGMFASNLYPDPPAHGHTWWEWYKYPVDSTTGDLAVDSTPSPSDTDAYSATAINKWIGSPRFGALGFGAGVTFGTSADNGYSVHAGVLLGLLTPGPVVFLDGKADVLKKLHGQLKGEANFHAMAVYDGNAGFFDVSMDVRYTVARVIDLQGGAELYIQSATPTQPASWFFALGKPPRDKRVTAKILNIFDATAYFVISDSGLVTGASFGISKGFDFGVVSAGVSAYIAALLAIQWAPFQIGGGLELHGEAHLVVFGLHFGLAVDALIEGCAPNPAWFHGEVSFELDLPWPLPNVGGTLSFDIGGDDGSVPPPPLSLTSIQAGMTDHSATDAYTLLAHETAALVSDATVRYDGSTEGILGPDAANQAAWDARIASASTPAAILPDLNPDMPPDHQPAALVPLDVHFTLNFSHPTHDKAGPGGATYFTASQADSVIQPDVEPVGLPSDVLPSDDMSHLNPNPPKPQWEYQHSLQQVGLYAFTGGVWAKVASSDDASTPVALRGEWQVPTPATSPAAVANTQLQVVVLSPSAPLTADWTTSAGAAGGTGETTTYPTTFQDEGLTFSTTNDSGAQRTAASLVGPALVFTAGATYFHVTIRFPAPVRVISVTAAQATNAEVPDVQPITWEGDSVTLPVASTTPSTAHILSTVTFTNTAPLVRELSCWIGPGYNLYLGSISWTQMTELLPQSDTLYALKVMTDIQARRVSDMSASFQPATPSGHPVVEFAYFQTASGPGVSVIDPTMTSSLPDPYAAAPYPTLARQAYAPTNLFPIGGRLTDLVSYAQWSWPGDQDLAAYYGYDLNLEFNEAYVNALYMAFSPDDAREALRFRVVDTNHRHIAPSNVAIAVPSAPGQSAIVADGSRIPAQPATIAPPPSHIIESISPGTLREIISIVEAGVAGAITGTGSATGGTHVSLTKAPSARAIASLNQYATFVSGAQRQPRFSASSEFIGGAEAAINVVAGSPEATITHDISGISRGVVGSGSRPGEGIVLDPSLDWGAILPVVQETSAAQEARTRWPRALEASRRYVVDVVTGVPGERDRDGSFEAVYAASDAIGALDALNAFYARLDQLTSLHHLDFTTSRYQTFTVHLANAVQQAQGGGAAPMRTYTVTTDVQAWLTTNDSGAAPGSRGAAQADYLAKRDDLQTFMRTFDPLHDETMLKSKRLAVDAAWQAFSAVSASTYDLLITALGMPDLASNAAAPAPPDTELSVLADGDGRIQALLLESPEPLPWRRLWRWTGFRTADAQARPVSETRVLWRGDGTRALIVPIAPYGSYQLIMTFQGNLGAEAPCITAHGQVISEPVAFQAMQFTPELSGPAAPHWPLSDGEVGMIPHIPVVTPLPPSIPTGPVPGPGPIERPVEQAAHTQTSFLQRLWMGFLRLIGVGR